MKKLLLFFLATLLILDSTRSQVVLNEFMSSNNSTIADEDGEYSDWIEMYNAGPDFVNLSSYVRMSLCILISKIIKVIYEYIFLPGQNGHGDQPVQTPREKNDKRDPDQRAADKIIDIMHSSFFPFSSREIRDRR